jgi:membrane protein implicated in regulation of membrane protease activity
MFGSDWLANLFLGVFFFGLIFTAVSLLLGFSHIGGLDGGHAVGHAGHAGGHGLNLDVAGHHVHVDTHDLHTHAELPDHDGPGFFNMPTIMAFLTWFGGVGYILRNSWALNGAFVVVLAALSGLVGGAIMFFLLARWLWPMMSKPLSSADYSLPGTPARVVSPIRAGGVGEIVYVKNGTRFTAGARSADENPIERGAEVVILDYSKGLASVQDVHKMLSGEKVAG